MGWGNPPVPWSELEARLSGRARPFPTDGDGGDSPAWSHKRGPYQPPAHVVRRRKAATTPYAELHCHSNFSFLDGASHPEELVEEATRLGLEALALTDHDGMYGVVRFAEAARAVGMPAVFGAELSLGLTRPQHGVADPEGTHLLVLARDPTGYTRLCRALSAAHLQGREKGKPVIDLDTLAAIGGGAVPDIAAIGDPSGSHPAGEAPADPLREPLFSPHQSDHWVVLTGCRKGVVPATLLDAGPGRAATALAGLQRRFGAANVVVEVWDHGDPLDSARNDALVEIAYRGGAEVVATNNVHYHVPARRRLAAAMAAVRARRSLDDIDGWLPSAAAAHLRSGREQAARFARYPGVVERAAALGRECAFDLSLVAPKLPPWPTPAGHSEMSWLRHLTEEGAKGRYGPRERPSHPRAWAQIDYELAMIEQLGFAGYFLIVWDIVRFCREHDIYCQGRGSAANSAVCFALGVTNADAVRLGLLFERFLSPERDGPPDIDVDIESGRREEAIQYVYQRYGRGCAAQVANVITYRPKSAVRDMGKALGAAPGQLDAWSKQVDGWGPLSATTAPGPSGAPDHDIPAPVLALAEEIQHFPRHLGIHSGGMVICDRPVSEVCPVEWARMADRSVLQWDKDDCAAAGLVKFDMLGLGMLTVLHATVDHIRDFHGVEVDLGALPQEDEVYQMLCRADSVGVFQVESRAQMATLPRLKPREFYDLVVEVALIRPGPIQGGSVHPYIRRRNGQEPVTYLHPLLERSLAKTLGVPLFQEQLMQMAIDVAGFTPAESDRLRQAMGSKRSVSKMEALRARLFSGMAERGITGEVADQIYEKLVAFANFGFPESHSVSFAYLVYSSSWMKLHYPAAFCAGLLDGQPMGFWSPQTIVADARRHGVVVRGPDVNASAAVSLLEACPSSAGGAAVRIGVSYVRTIGSEVADRIAAGRPYSGIEDLVRRCGLSTPQAEALATAGALGCFGLPRREALWAAGAVAQSGPSLDAAVGRRSARLAGLVTGAEPPRLPGMDPVETNRADLWATGLSPDSYPTEFVRDDLDRMGVVTAAGLVAVAADVRVTVAGVVTHRQRPATAQGIIFLNLEDETGLINVVCSRGAWARYRRVARAAPALIVTGKLERVEGVINVVADRIEALTLSPTALRSRDFR
ncbi:error-prone DNA polymerase [Acidiferrimicrobium sp. IK]|uniref:error-prone DNA polymerase n=1 Tax=Acidiferrimicrobium sp. IK TaxID=2871700 RepID=UPI0021CB21BF|nr:error-prone DNA polymerase [Acidiferrimicrobium sp. IK]MCU4184135.1 error-prone DNA polymerase [Acidiferrimicrobium sp. IK]